MKSYQLVLSLFLSIALLFLGCKQAEKRDTKPVEVQEPATDKPETHGTEVKESDVVLKTPLDQSMVTAGKNIAEVKCQSCHKLTGERLVGPGWKDVTKRRQPVWIMNMITNVEMMLETDPEAQKLLEQCLVRMPNQNISKDEARQLLEFMRHNDGVK